MSTTYRIYLAPDGCDPEYCGERDTYQEAVAYAETEPAGLEQSLWETARVAGHCGGMMAPGYGAESDEPMSWHGAAGWHCVVEVSHAETTDD